MGVEPDWGEGDYSRTAARLAPVADHLVRLLDVAPGMRLLDVGCGTGNVALSAARMGARVWGLDPSATLVEAARTRAAREGVTLGLAVGDAASAPRVAGDGFDVAASCFAVVFAPHPAEAVAGMRDVLRPGGRLGLTAWRGGDALGGLSTLLWQATPRPWDAAGQWHDPEWVTALLTRAGLRDVRVSEGTHVVRHTTPAAYHDEVEHHHPVWRWARNRVDDARWRHLRADGIRLLTEANEDPAAFVSTAGYWVVTARRAGRSPLQ